MRKFLLALFSLQLLIGERGLAGGNIPVMFLPLPSAVCVAGTASFNSTGSDQTWVVPAGCSSVTVKMWGAAGAGGYGGAGGFSMANLDVTGGESLTIIVGSSGGYGGGGSGIYGGGTGGGRSAIRRSTTELMTAGGGGGAGASAGRQGGAGGGASGQACGDGGAAGGTQSSGYAQYQGANSNNSGATYFGGGGGGGYWGGGGGSSGTGFGRSGAGGSGYVPAGGVSVAGNYGTPGNSLDTIRPAGVAVGDGTNGNGYVWLSWGGTTIANPTDCRGHYSAGSTSNGYYVVDPDGAGAVTPFLVYCDMTFTAELVTNNWKLVYAAPGTRDSTGDYLVTAGTPAIASMYVDSSGKFNLSPTDTKTLIACQRDQGSQVYYNAHTKLAIEWDASATDASTATTGLGGFQNGTYGERCFSWGGCNFDHYGFTYSWGSVSWGDWSSHPAYAGPTNQCGTDGVYQNDATDWYWVFTRP